MKILVVKLSAFGDMIHALPALDDLLCQPEVSEVHWLVDMRYAFVSEIFPKNVVVHTVAMRGKQALASTWRLVRQLKKERFDVILDMQGLLKSALMARSSGSNVYGFDQKYLREKASTWFIQPVTFHPDEKHVVQQYRRIAMAPFTPHPGLSPPSALAYKPPRIEIAQTCINRDKNLLQQLKLTNRQFIVLHTAGGWETKQLPEQSWLTIAKALNSSEKIPVFSWGTLAEKTLAHKLAEQCNGLALPEKLDMSALCTLLKGARAVVGADTGLLHLAAALGTPTITFWGPSASWRSAPFADTEKQGDQHWHIESNPACGPCFKRSCDHFICMDAIDPESITGILRKI